MYVCIYMFTYVYIHVYIHVYICAYIYIYLLVHLCLTLSWFEAHRSINRRVGEVKICMPFPVLWMCLFVTQISDWFVFLLRCIITLLLYAWLT